MSNILGNDDKADDPRRYYVGKCQSCAHSEGNHRKVGLCLVCKVDYRPVQPQWTCARYEYEPGSLG